MTQWKWVLAVMVLSVGGFVVWVAYYLPPPRRELSSSASASTETVTEERPPSPRRRSTGFVLHDVYTSDAAAEKAYMEQLQAQTRAPEENEMLIPDTFIGLLDSLLEESESPALASAESEWTPSTTTPPPVTPAILQSRREVESLVEGFLRDAFHERNPEAYLAALDDDFRYTYASPNDPNGGRSYRGRGYEAVGIYRLFERFPNIRSELSPPREFQLLRPDAAQITYDYDITLRNTRESRRVAGTATFLVVRGGTSGDSDEWRIVEWYDVPLQRR